MAPDRTPQQSAVAGDRVGLIRSLASLPRPLYLFLLLSALLTCASYLFSQISRAAHLGLPYAFPYYFVPSDLGSDLRYFWTKFNQYPTPLFYTGDAGYLLYPLPLFYVLWPLFASHHPFFVFPVVVLLLSSLLVYVFVRSMKAAGMIGGALLTFVAATTLLSYPLAFEYLRLNIEIFLFSLSAAGVLFWWLRKPYLAAFFFGIAGACKVYPLILLGLLFSERRWRPLLFGFATTVVTVLASFAAFGPTVRTAAAWNAFQLGLFQRRYAGLPTQLGYDHSFFALAKFFTLPWHPGLSPWVPVYVRTAALLSLLLYFVRIRKLPALNQVTVLSILSITLPPVSFDYTLLAMYPPLILLSMEVCRRYRAGLPYFSAVTPLFVLFALVLTPLSFVTVAGYRFSGQLRCFFMIALLWMALRYPMASTEERAVEDAGGASALPA